MQNVIQRTLSLTLLPLALCGAAYGQAAATPALAPATAGIVMRTAAATDADPFAAGKTAALALKAAMGGSEIKAVMLTECFEDKENKEQVLKGVASVIGADKIMGGACYGMYTQAGVVTEDAVALLGIGGNGVTVTLALEEKMGASGLSLEKQKDELTAALQGAGARLAKKLGNQPNQRLLILMADAHSPKNQLLLDGVQSVLGKKLPVTGGSVSKNAGQNWLCFNGQLHTDAAAALLVSGDFTLAQTGKQAKENDLVIATAKSGAADAIKALGKDPFALLAFDCAGRKGKLKNVADELAAIQTAIPKQTVLFGCYCAGEFGPADTEDVADKSVSYGRGWHVMFSALGKN